MRIHLCALLALSAAGPAGAHPVEASGGAVAARTAAVVPPTATAPAAYDLARRVLATGDHGSRPFAVVDKRAAQLVLFHADGRPAGSTPVLLGRDRGDATVPGVGERTQRQQLRPGDHTTPAGRFEARSGRNFGGEVVIWVDPDAAFAIHRLRPGASHALRQRLLSSPAAGAKRASAGCVVVPEGFFDGVVRPVLGRGPSVVYVMPENGAWQALWPALAAGTSGL